MDRGVALTPRHGVAYYPVDALIIYVTYLLTQQATVDYKKHTYSQAVSKRVIMHCTT